jgi:hypothetical protein
MVGLFTFLAESTFEGGSNVIAPFLGAGIPGAILWWFATKNDQRLLSVENRMTNVENALDRSTKAQLVQTLVHPALPEAAKPKIQEVIDEIDKKTQT